MKALKKHFLLLFALGLLLFASSCGGDEPEAQGSVSILSSSINGSAIVGNMSEVGTESQIAITFNAAVDPVAFESALSIRSPQGAAPYQLSFRNASSRVLINLSLEFGTSYSFTLQPDAIGAKGQLLDKALQFDFTTAETDMISSLPPCGSATNDCLESASFSEGSQEAEFSFYSNYPIYEEKAAWKDLKTAMIVVHGANRNGDDYFNWLHSTLEGLQVEENTVLIAPLFKQEPEAASGELYWAGNRWREGQNSASPIALSSFEVIDALITQLADKERFPALERVIVSGHSSGGLFTHAYAAANSIDGNIGLPLEYVVANSQYFYYPDPRRINQTTGELFTPANCPLYNRWPLGYREAPPYLAGIPEEQVDAQFIDRSISYLLGNGNDPDPSLNTSDCGAMALGSTRFRRGENMFRFMELAYPESHSHQSYEVEGIGHDGQRMYQSEEFEALLTALME